MDLPATAEDVCVAATEPGASLPAARHAPIRRRPLKAALQVLRRGHLYAGLLMLPWVILYGVTAFLFNHPTAFSDQPTATFGRDALTGTPMESPPAPADLAGQVVAALRARAKPDATYTLVAPDQARYTREFAFATVKADGAELNVLLDATGNGGTVRNRPGAAPKVEESAAPFAIGGRPAGGRGMAKGGERGGPRGGDRGGPRGGDGLKLDRPLHERVQASVPAVLEKTGFPAGEVTVTSVPDLSFLMGANGTVWRVTYNAQTGSVAGRPADEPASENTLSPRRFLTRLHTTHGYPGEWGARWVWAAVVDAMAAVMVFWGASGLLMWWQIKATRWVGLAVLLASAAAAAWVGVGMHDLMTAAPVGR